MLCPVVDSKITRDDKGVRLNFWGDSYIHNLHCCDDFINAYIQVCINAYKIYLTMSDLLYITCITIKLLTVI